MERNHSNHSDSPVGDRGSPRRRSSSRKSPPSRIEGSPTRPRRPQRDSSSPREKNLSKPRSPKHARSPSPPARSPSPRTKRFKRVQSVREAEKEPERNNGRRTDRDFQKEGGSEKDVGSNRKERRLGRGHDTDDKFLRSRRGASPSDQQRRNRHRSPSPQPAGEDLEKNHGRRGDRISQREKVSDRETESEGVERRSGKGNTDHRSSRSRHGRSTSPLDRHYKNRHRSHSPQQAANTRARDEVPNSREVEHGDDENDAVAMMKAAEEALEAKQKQKPSFELSGKLAAETNRVKGITLLFTEPSDARKPEVRWRLYVFKNGEVLKDPLYLHRQSCYLFGRERRVADIPTDHPSCSKQHAVIQYRQVEMEQPDGTLSKKVRPYLMDLGSTNKTFLNDIAIEPQRYYELMEKDTIRFGNSSREYVLLHENSMD